MQKKLSRHELSSAAAWLSLVCLLLAHTPGVAGTRWFSGEPIKGAFKNEKAVQRGDSIVISFKLDAPADETYQISIRLKRRDDPGFSRTLRFVRGDIGQGEFGQKGCRIIWLYKRELSEAELGEDYLFELTCEVVEHGTPWWVYAGGGAVGVTAGVLLLTHKKTTGADATFLPGPPDYRPATP